MFNSSVVILKTLLYIRQKCQEKGVTINPNPNETIENQLC